MRLAQALGIDSSTTELVAIDHDQVQRIAAHILKGAHFTSHSPAAWDDDTFWNVADEPHLRSQFFAIGNAINFRFWTRDSSRLRSATGSIQGEAFRGSMYMWRCLRRALDHGVPLLDAEFLARLDPRQFDAIFADDLGRNPLAVAADDRIANLRDLGSRLCAEWDRSFFKVVEASGGSLVEFASLCRQFRAFDDPLYKLTMVNAILHSGSGVAAFSDEPLPGIDYHLLKQALRQRLLRPAPAFAEKLRAGELLDVREGYDLRRTALLAFVGLAEQTGLSGEFLDNKYWLNRVNCRDADPVCLDASTASRCPFFGTCLQATGFGLPLELTRYY